MGGFLLNPTWSNMLFGATDICPTWDFVQMGLMPNRAYCTEGDFYPTRGFHPVWVIVQIKLMPNIGFLYNQGFCPASVLSAQPGAINQHRASLEGGTRFFLLNIGLCPNGIYAQNKAVCNMASVHHWFSSKWHLYPTDSR